MPDDEVANHINDFFCNIGPRLARDHNEPWRFYGRRCDNKCPGFSVDYEQVASLCKEIEISKSSGIADIASKKI